MWKCDIAIGGDSKTYYNLFLRKYDLKFIFVKIDWVWVKSLIRSDVTIFNHNWLEEVVFDEWIVLLDSSCILIWSQL